MVAGMPDEGHYDHTFLQVRCRHGHARPKPPLSPLFRNRLADRSIDDLIVQAHQKTIPGPETRQVPRSERPTKCAMLAALRAGSPKSPIFVAYQAKDYLQSELRE